MSKIIDLRNLGRIQPFRLCISIKLLVNMYKFITVNK